VINKNTDNVTPIDVATNTAGPSFAHITGQIQDIVMSPDQAPVASFSINAQSSGLPTQFNASASISPIGTIASYAWDFGDGTTLITNTPIVNHIYASTGSFNVMLTVTNSAGTSTSKVFSSRFMSNNGGPIANISHNINISPSPPTDVKGFQKSCRYPTQTDLINVIKWNPPSIGELPVAYRIYRDAALTDLIATISANLDLKFEDHNRKNKKSYTYFIVSVSAMRTISSSVSVTIKPKK
jgi:PKD repeat protein